MIATECTTSQLCCPLHDVECHAGANVILGDAWQCWICAVATKPAVVCHSYLRIVEDFHESDGGDNFGSRLVLSQDRRPSTTIIVGSRRHPRTIPDQSHISMARVLNSRPYKSGFRGLCCYFRVVVFQGRRRTNLRTLRQIPQT